MQTTIEASEPESIQIQPVTEPNNVIKNAEDLEGIRRGHLGGGNMMTPDNSPDSTPKSEQCSLLESPKRTLAEYAQLITEHYGNVQKWERESAKIGRTTVQAAIKCGQYANEAKHSGLIKHGDWEKWVNDNCKNGFRSITKWRKLADYYKEHPKEIDCCINLKEAEIVCGARTWTPPNKKEQKGETNRTEIPNIPEIIIGEMRRAFEHIESRYAILTNANPELNRFLLGQGYDSDLPLLLQKWQSSLNDALAYFNLPPVEPDICVRCGHVRESDELFVPISAYYPLQHLQKFNLWCEQCDRDYDFDFEKKKYGVKKYVIEDLPKAIKELADNLNQLKSLTDPKQYILALKNDQLKETKIATASVIKAAENNEWQPSDINDEQKTISEIQSLLPKIVIIKRRDEAANQLWEIYRRGVSSARYDTTPGEIRFLVVNDGQPEKPVLGIGAIANDLKSLKLRDEFIGWTREQKDRNRSEGGRNVNIAIGSTIVPTQSLGRNFIGGKLIAALITSGQVRNEWKARRGDILAGMTTTSLYGGYSMYSSMKQWKKLGETKGSQLIHPKDEIYKMWKDFVKDSRWYEWNRTMKPKSEDASAVSNAKSRALTMIFKAAGLNPSDYEDGHRKGLYFAEFYENTKEFLCGKISEKELKLKPLFAETVEEITNNWRQKAIERYQKLKQSGELTTQRRPYDRQLSIEDLDNG